MPGTIGQVPEDSRPPLRGLMDTAEFAAVIETRGAEDVAARLAPFLTEARRARIEAVLRARVTSLQIAIEDPQDPHNAAAVVRTAEALGAGAVHVIGGRASGLLSRRVTRGTFYWADIRHHADWDDFRADLPVGMQLAGACVEPGTVELAAVPADRPLCLLFGNEQAGLSARARAACTLHFRIPMTGMAESLNLSVAAGIAMYALIERRRALLRGSGDLPDRELAGQRARWYAKAIDPRLVRRALEIEGVGTQEESSS
jgi:tRNA (guanosine-2'-O-)-methyltransferase